MMPSRGMGDINSKMPKARTITRKDDPNKVKVFKAGGKSRVNEAGNYTKPGMRKAIFERIKAGGKGGAPGQWSARKAQMMAQQYKKAGGVIKIESSSKKPEGLGRPKMED
jgi:ABC-type transport system substrate-binding protein